MDDFYNELGRIREVNNDAYASNWHFLQLSMEEFMFSAKYMKLVTNPDHIWFVESQGEPIGVLHCVLDINPLLRKMKGKIGLLKYWKFRCGRKKIRKLVVFTVGIKKANQGTGVFPILLKALRQVALKYQFLETAWMPEDSNHPAVKAADRLGLKPDKQFVIYEKKLINK
jgi:hypothetical protein